MSQKLRRIQTYLLAAIAMSLAWSLRGQFGHLKGALIPGAMAAVIAVIFRREEIWRRSFGLAVIFSSLGFSLGGHLGYGQAIETILTASSLQSVSFYLLRIFFIGAVWGGLGLSFLGFGLSEKPFVLSDLILLASLSLLWFIPLGLFNAEAYDLALFGTGLLAIHAYNLFVKKSRMLSIFGVAGILGFGTGFLLSVLLLYAGGKGMLPGNWPWWNLRDQWFGFLGGIAIILAAHRIEYLRLEPVPEMITLTTQKAGLIFFAALIPFVNGLNVLTHWALENPILSGTGLFISIVILGLFFGALSFFFARADSNLFQGRTLDRTLYFSVLFFIWFLSFTAIAKSILPYGFSRWEPAFTLFLTGSLVLTLFLPAAIYRKD